MFEDTSSGDPAGFEQLNCILDVHYRRMVEMRDLYRVCQRLCDGDEALPVIALPVAGEDGEVRNVEIDLRAISPTHVTEDQRLAFYRQQFGPWLDYAGTNWYKAAQNLAHYSSKLVLLMQNSSGEPAAAAAKQPQPAVSVPSPPRTPPEYAAVSQAEVTQTQPPATRLAAPYAQETLLWPTSPQSE